MYLLLTDLSGKNDPWCTVGSKARRSSLPWLLMSLLSSNLYGFLCFSPLFSQSVLVVFFFHLTCLLSVCNTLQKMCFNWKCPVDLRCSFCCLQFLTITPGLSPDKSKGPALSRWLCAALTDQWASQLIPSLVFVEFWNVCCWWIRP